jgi:23S rRNA (adenine2503-C2)-methyltransferase
LPIYSLSPIQFSESKDKKTIKILFELNDKEKIEAVLMKFEDGRKTVCVSSQVGCTLGCAFCSTGKGGFKRNLTYEEITDQVLYFEHILNKSDEHINHVVFMGMGEPFLNYEEVMKAVSILNDPVAFDIGMRNMTLSTSGIIPGIEKLINDNKQINLAISLHAPNDEIRKKIMPIANKYSLDDLMKVCEKYIEETHRRISYEYIMLRGINDKDEHAHELATLLRGQLCHVNLIPYNETHIKNMKASTKNRIDTFKDILELNNIPVTVRVSLGKDIDAACGQLAGKK